MIRRLILRTVAPQKTQGPVRRLQGPVISVAKEEAARSAVRGDLKSIAEIDAHIDMLVERRDAAIARIDEEMRAALLKTVAGSGLVAALNEKFTRQSRTIDPKKFRNKVTNEAFWGSISVSVQEAKKFLSERELDAVSDVVPAQSLGVVLTVSDAKKSKS